MKKFSIIFLITFFTPTMCFGAFFNKPASTENIDSASKGYIGTLPDLTSGQNPDEPAVSTPIFDRTKNFNSSNEVKPIPRDNPAFVNIILKQDKMSPYVNDIQDFIEMFEQIYDSIENEENIQRFAARVYFLNKNAEYFRDKYANRPESGYTSYEKLLEVNLHAKNISELRTEAEKYKPYFTYNDSGSIYNINSINEQLGSLKSEVEEIINILKDTK